jgi:hypothetical protein
MRGFVDAASAISALALLAQIAACGGGGGDGGGSSGTAVPVNMTLTAVALDAHAAGVRWSGLSGPPTRYELYMNGAFYASAYPSSASSTSESVRVGSLTAGRQYCFHVDAIGFLLGVYARSNEACVVLPADAPPSTPAALAASASTPARIELTWAAAVDDWGVARYRVTRDGTLLSTVPGTTYVDSSPNPSTTYCYTVTAIDTGDNASPPSAPACATTAADTQPPTAPTSLSARADDTVVNLSWNASTDNGAVARYRIIRDGTLQREIPAPAEAGVTTVTATDTGLNASTQYCYEVIAIDRANNASPASNRACTTTSWTLTTVLPSPPLGYLGDLNALAIDSSGALHIAYSYIEYDPVVRIYTTPELRYLTGASSPWSSGATLYAPLSNLAYNQPAITVTASTRHAAFVDGINSFPYYAAPGVPNVVERVSMDSATGISIAADGAGLPHLAYGGSALRYGKRTAGTWSVATVPGSGSSGAPRLVLDPGGNAHIAYMTSTAAEMRYATNAGGGWTVVSVVTGSAGRFYSPAIGVDGNGTVHIVYSDGTAGGLSHATNRGGTWTSIPVDVTGSTVVSIAAVVDGAGVVHASYVDPGTSRVKYASNRGGSWRSFDIDFARWGSSGWGSTSIALDPAGRANIVYYSGGLRLAIAP